MLVTEIFQRLATGYLSNLSMSNEGSNIDKTSDKNKIIGYTNEALMKIYSRFSLKEDEILINQYAHITNYHLDKRFALYNADRPVGNLPYILDRPSKRYNDDAIKVIRVTNQVGDDVPLNDSSKRFSMFTPYPTILQTPYPQEDQILSVIYQASHDKLIFDDFTSNIIIPAVLEGPLLSLISYFIYRDMNTQESTAKGQEHSINYETDCLKIEQRDQASITSIENNTKFSQRGFV